MSTERLNTQEKTLYNLIKANVKLIQIVSYETLRFHGMLIHVSEEIERDLYIWNRVDGIKKWNGSHFEVEKDEGLSEGAIDFYKENDNIILLLEDFYPDFTEDKPRMIRTLRNIAAQDSENKTLIFSQPFLQLPKELEKDVHILDLPYPKFEDQKQIYKRVCERYGISSEEPAPELIEAALGLTIMEAEKAFSLAYIENKQLTRTEIPLVIREKENVIKKSGYLEYYHPKETMNDVGGLGNLKDWLQKRGRGFDSHAKDFGLTYPKGILLLGIPGTGKSLTAKAVGNLWHFPLLRLDMGKIFGGIVGESEKNIREALKIAEAISPSILWVDEIEKGMSGISSSGSTDGGTTARVLGTFLTWMQEKTSPVFVVATANDISQLPPELLRKGRVDEIFFVDLPTQKEREQIIKIHLQKKGRNPNNFDVETLAKEAKGFSGAELEEAVKEALFQAYDEEKEINDSHISKAIAKTYPLSCTMSETIEKMRKWAKSRAVAASTENAEPLDNKNGDTPKLKQETYSNPFI